MARPPVRIGIILNRRFLISLLIVLVLAVVTVGMAAAADRGPWAPNVSYAVNDTVTYNGSTYKCLQAHTSLTGWEPPNVPALWQLTTGTPPPTTPPPTTPPPTTPPPTTPPPTTPPPTTPPPSGNLALNRPATGSASCNTNETPAKAVNGSVSGGNTDKFCSTATTKWLQVDLGSSRSVTQFVVKHAGAGGESTSFNTRGFNIQTSTDNATWSTAVTVTANTANISTHNITARNARYIRLNITQPQQTTGGAARIYEFEVYGGTVPPTTPPPTTPPATTPPPTTPPPTTPPPTTPPPTTPPPTGLPKHVMVGYWHNFDNGSGFIPLRNVSTKWDVIIVAFAEPTNGSTGGTMGFTPYNTSMSQFQSDVAYLKSQGKKVLISIGGANGTVQLNSTGARDNFVNSMRSIINTYGFDGMDIDFEGQSLILNAGDNDPMAPTTPVIVNTVSAIRSIRSSYGSNFILTMAPETFFVQLGYSFYGGTCSGCDRRAGAFLPVLYGTRDILSWVQVQDYNSGPIMGLDNQYHTMGGADFHIAMLDMLLAGFPVAGTGKTFPALRADQVVLGLPATVNAGNGYVAPATVQSALNYIIRGTATGSYVKRSANAPNLRGVMTWSINWDAYQGIFEFSNSYRTYLNGLP